MTTNTARWAAALMSLLVSGACNGADGPRVTLERIEPIAIEESPRADGAASRTICLQAGIYLFGARRPDTEDRTPATSSIGLRAFVSWRDLDGDAWTWAPFVMPEAGCEDFAAIGGLTVRVYRVRVEGEKL